MLRLLEGGDHPTIVDQDDNGRQLAIMADSSGRGNAQEMIDGERLLWHGVDVAIEQINDMVTRNTYDNAAAPGLVSAEELISILETIKST